MNRTFFGLDKKGGFKIWNIRTEQTVPTVAWIVIQHGKEGGAMTEQLTEVKSGKQGRTVLEQAISEAEGKIKKQMDKGYRENKADLEELPVLPMLAGDYNKIGHRINWTKTVYGSDKLDGVRCMAKCVQKLSGKDVILESRTGQPYSLPHIEEELRRVMEVGEVYDGEIYLHGYVLQEITSAVKRTDTQSEVDKVGLKLQKLGTQIVGSESFEYSQTKAGYEEAVKIHNLRPQLQFIIFDTILGDMDKRFEERLVDLECVESALRARECESLYAIWYYTLESEAAMKRQHADCVSRGFEGIMLRNADGLYESGKRSADLQKFKTFLDSEFVIVDVVTDKEGCAVFVCQNDMMDNTFQVVMGEKEQKKKWALTPEDFIGKMITVKYQSRYKGTLLPQFPVGLAIRDYE